MLSSNDPLVRSFVAVWAIVLGVLLMVAGLIGCAGTVPKKSSEHPHPVKESIVKFISCMAEPPAMEAIDWPDADRLGNVLLHASTAERLREAYAALRRYVNEQYFRCLKIQREWVDSLGGDGTIEGDLTTVEVEYDPGGAP